MLFLAAVLPSSRRVNPPKTACHWLEERLQGTRTGTTRDADCSLLLWGRDTLLPKLDLSLMMAFPPKPQPYLPRYITVTAIRKPIVVTIMLFKIRRSWSFPVTPESFSPVNEETRFRVHRRMEYIACQTTQSNDRCDCHSGWGAVHRWLRPRSLPTRQQPLSGKIESSRSALPSTSSSGPRVMSGIVWYELPTLSSCLPSTTMRE